MLLRKTHLLREVPDLINLLLITLSIPLVWALLGWKPSLLAVGHDAVALQAPQLQRLLQVAGDWSETLYRPDTQGGIQIHEIYGTLPIQQLFALFKFSITNSINFTIFFIQTLYCFFSLKICRDLNTLWNNHIQFPLFFKLLMIILFSFSPIMGWKLAYGHSHLILGCFTYIALFSMFISIFSNSITVLSSILGSIAIVHSVTSNGQQAIIYSFSFGLPIFIGLAFSVISTSTNSPSSRPFLLLSLLLISSILIGLPNFIPMVLNALSTDSSRTLNSDSIIYSYITANWTDWITSIPWTTAFLPASRAPILYHEINYPIGPLLLFLSLIPKQAKHGLIYGAFFSLLVAIAFSMNWTPVSEGLATAIPFLKIFRVPERAMLTFSLISPIIAISGLWFKTSTFLKRINTTSFGTLALAFYILTVFIISPPIIRESLIWAGSLIYIILISYLTNAFIPSATLTLWLFLALGSFYSFQERLLLPFFSLDTYSKQMAKIGQLAKEAFPDLQSPLTRISFDTNSYYLGVNYPYFMKLSTIDGYWVPQRRFSEFTLKLMNENYHPTINNFTFNSRREEHKILALLYNVAYELQIDSVGFRVKKLSPTLGPAWFSQNLVPLSSQDELINELKKDQVNLAQRLKYNTWYVSTDLVFNRFQVPKITSGNCDQSKVINVTTAWDSQEIHIKVEPSTHLCPLNIAMNYSPNLLAKAVTVEHNTQNLTIFPSYGSLTGLIVPQSTNEIIITATSIKSPLISGLFLLGILLWFSSLSYLLIRS